MFRTVFLWMLLALWLIPGAGHAQFLFTTNNGAITITGYTDTNANVVIPATINGYPVTSVGYSAFDFRTDVTNVVIPSGVTNIDVQAFFGCSLIVVTIPDSVRTIGQSAFGDCTSLINVSIGTNVTTIDWDAFDDCISLTNVLIPRSVTNLLPAFFACTHLTNFVVDPLNPVYSSSGGVLFDKNKTKLVCIPGGVSGTYTVPGTVTNIADYVYTAFTITNVIIPSNVAIIGQYAFQRALLSGLAFTNGLTSIGQYAFAASLVTNVFIPATVTNIGVYAFSFSSLRGYNVDSNNPAYCSVNGILFDATRTTLVAFPIGQSGTSLKPGNYVITNGVTRIADAAFAICLFSNVTIAATVTSIGNEAFRHCRFLTNLTIPYGVTNIGNSAFEGTAITNLIVPASVTSFGWLGNFLHLAVYFEGNAPGSVPGIPPTLFLGDSITVYYLPGATGWGSYFQNGYNLTALWLPKMPTSGTNFGVRTNRFGFTVNWAAGHPVAIDACTNLSNPAWQPLETNALATGSYDFSDPQWTNSVSRFYRLRMP